jgi:hypothetical protein
MIAKADGYDFLRVSFHTAGFGDSSVCWFNLSTGAVGASSGNFEIKAITPVGGGYYRCDVRDTSDASIATAVRFHASNADGVTNFAGDGSKGIIVWNPQFELGQWPSSPIKTEASSVVRAKDQFNWTNSDVPDWIRDEKHAILWIPEAASADTRASQSIYFFDDTGSSDSLHVRVATDDKIYVTTFNGGSINRVVSAALTWARDSINLILIDPANGTIELPFTTGGDLTTDTSWDGFMAATGTLHYGMDNSSASQIDGLLSQPYTLE